MSAPRKLVPASRQKLKELLQHRQGRRAAPAPSAPAVPDGQLTLREATALQLAALAALDRVAEPALSDATMRALGDASAKLALAIMLLARSPARVSPHPHHPPTPKPRVTRAKAARQAPKAQPARPRRTAASAAATARRRTPRSRG